MAKKKSNTSKVRNVEIVDPSYQPSRAELREDARVDATFDEAIEALTRPVKIQYVERPNNPGK